MLEVITQLSANIVLMSAVTAWFVAQVLKVVVVLLVQRKLDMSLVWSSGGMPSSHSALVTALAVNIGHQYGFQSAYFAIAAVFSFIVMYDAAGVRLAAGKQAEVLNQIIENLYPHQDRKQERLKELIGHTPVEVFAGCLLGIIIAFVY